MTPTLSQHPKATEQRCAIAYRMGAEDGRDGIYRPTTYYHYDDARIADYDRGHASVCVYPWRWTDSAKVVRA